MNLNDSDKKKLRAERFGTTHTAADAKKGSQHRRPNVDAAQRLGLPVKGTSGTSDTSSSLADSQNSEERKKARPAAGNNKKGRYSNVFQPRHRTPTKDTVSPSVCR